MVDKIKTIENIHQEMPLIIAGKPIEEASGAMIMVHGRGANGYAIMKIADYLDTGSLALLAPQAAGGLWYPQRFLSPIAENEPWLSSALDTIRQVLNRVMTAGIPAQKTILLGFSQGACLALEFAARNPRRYGGVIGLSGGLIGDDNESSFQGRRPRMILPGNTSLEGTPVFLGCSDIDFHIPRYRVEDSAQSFSLLGATVDLRLYPEMDHTINDDEIQAVQEIIHQVNIS